MATLHKQVGDVHPNGLWEWREYAPGKCTWQVINKDFF